MRKFFILAAITALVIAGMARPVVADDDDADAKKKREDIFGKSFEDQVEDAVDRGCDWLKKQQGIDPIDPKPVFGKFPENPPLYGAGEPHRYLVARTAFPIQALCKSGVWYDEPEIQKAMEWLRENYKEAGAVDMLQGNVGTSTYEDATLINAVEAYYISKWETEQGGYSNPKSRYKKVEDENGKKVKVPLKRWGTEEKGAKKKKKDRKLKLSREDEKMCEIAIKAIESKFRNAYGGGGWRYKKTGVGESQPIVDVSATQYAILGLKSATRLGIKYDKKILLDVFRYLRLQQDKEGPEVEAHWKKREEEDDKKDDRKTGTGTDGNKKKLHARGWGYNRKDMPNDHAQLINSYGSMTAAAVNALILIRDEMVADRGQKKTWDKVEEDCNVAIGDGLAWLVANWTMQNNPKAGMHRYYYYLYTIERLGMLGGIDFIGGHDWYVEGAKVLLDQQEDGGNNDGMWDPQHEVDPSDIYNTCYALLFLKRATEGVDQPIPVITGDGGG